MSTSKLNFFAQHSISQLIKSDIETAQNDEDLRYRLAANGYGFRDTNLGRILVTIPHNVELFPLQNAFLPNV